MPWLNSALEQMRDQLAAAMQFIDDRRLDAVILVFDKRLRPSREIVVTVAIRPKLLELAATDPRSLPDEYRAYIERGPATAGTYHCLAYRGVAQTPEDEPASDVEYGLLSGKSYVRGGNA